MYYYYLDQSNVQLVDESDTHLRELACTIPLITELISPILGYYKVSDQYFTDKPYAVLNFIYYNGIS